MKTAQPSLPAERPSAGGVAGKNGRKRAAKEPDWKKIAYELARRCVFVVTHIRDPGGGGLVINMKTGKSQHWRDYVADGIEMMPGVKVDREKLHLTNLSYGKRKKAFAELEKARASKHRPPNP